MLVFVPKPKSNRKSTGLLRRAPVANSLQIDKTVSKKVPEVEDDSAMQSMDPFSGVISSLTGGGVVRH